MKLGKTKIILIGGVLILSVLGGLFVRMSLKKPQLKSGQTSMPTQSSVEFPKPLLSSEKQGQLKETAPESFSEPNPEVIFEEKSSPSAAIPFFDNVNKAIKTVEKSLMPDNTPAQNASITTSTGIILSLTDEQFHFLYPDNFIASLIDAQNSFIKEYNSAYESLSKIETDSQVRFVEEKIVATLLSANMITKEKAERFITTIRFTLPQLQLIDLKRYNSYGLYESSPISEFLNAILGRTESPQAAPKGLFLAGLMEELTDALAHKARAAVCGHCMSAAECFQEGAFTPATAGTEVIKFACYCSGCLSSLGCLSSCEGQAAIYDQVTGICACGLGISPKEQEIKNIKEKIGLIAD
jgi:hypothetical protein